MKLPDCAFDIDVKSAFTFWDPIFLLEVTACQRGPELKKQPVYILNFHYMWQSEAEFNDFGLSLETNCIIQIIIS